MLGYFVNHPLGKFIAIHSQPLSPEAAERLYGTRATIDLITPQQVAVLSSEGATVVLEDLAEAEVLKGSSQDVE